MKKVIVLMSSAAILMSGVLFTGCGGGSETEANKDTVAAEPVAELPDPMINEGLELIGKSDCLTCHKLNEVATGPAYAAVAAKYATDQTGRDSLAHKIMKGGSGNWGAIPMPPHPNLTEEDAKKMVAYVMSVKAE